MNEENQAQNTQEEAVEKNVSPKKSFFTFFKQCKLFKKCKDYSLKKKILTAVLIVVVLYGGWFLAFKVFKSAPKQIYEVAVYAHNQSGSDSSSSMRMGDALVVMKEGHSWSHTESISYLILKMSLSEEQAQKLSMADEKEIPFKQWSDEEKQRAEEEEARAKEEDREYFEEPKRETLRPRLYRIDFEDKVFEGFTRVQLMQGQPYKDMVFDWGIVEKKDKL